MDTFGIKKMYVVPNDNKCGICLDNEIKTYLKYY